MSSPTPNLPIIKSSDIDPAIKSQVNTLLKPLILSNDQLHGMKVTLEDQFKKGLASDNPENGSLRMLLTYVQNVPKGDEVGYALGLDLGGTNFRVLKVVLKGGADAVIESEKFTVSDTLKTGPGQDLFEFIADCLLKFVSSRPFLLHRRLPLGFTFSFPCKQYGLAQGTLLQWTKGFNCTHSVGRDVVRMLKSAIRKRQFTSRIDARIDLIALMNDTTGTLMSCAVNNRDCRVGLIVGTGTNMCYMEKTENIPKWNKNFRGEKFVAVNTEWGAFGDAGELDAIRTDWDRALDMASINPGRQRFEKMISGLYLGEIGRRILMTLIEKGLLFRGSPTGRSAAVAVLGRRDTFQTAYVSRICSDDKYSTYAGTRRVLVDDLKLPPGSYNATDLEIVRRVCDRISVRAAYLVAAGLATVIDRIPRHKTTVGYDGTMLKLHRYFTVKMKEKMTELVESHTTRVHGGNEQVPKTFDLQSAEDGSGRGAAIVALVAYRERRPVINKRGNFVIETFNFPKLDPVIEAGNAAEVQKMSR